MTQINLTSEKKLILGGDPKAPFSVPGKDVFEREGEWVEATGCEKIAEAMIEKLLPFESLKDATISFLWKAKGSTSPKLLLGKCQRPSGLLRHFSHCDFVVWFAANNCRDLAFNNWQMEALIFHELMHAKMEDGVAVSVPHEFEGFSQEIRRYGIWKRDIRPIAEASSQALLFDGGRIIFDEKQ